MDELIRLVKETRSILISVPSSNLTANSVSMYSPFKYILACTAFSLKASLSLSNSPGGISVSAKLALNLLFPAILFFMRGSLLTSSSGDNDLTFPYFVPSKDAMDFSTPK